MYTYEFERINAIISGWGGLAGTKYEMEKCREIITERARSGWRYVGTLPVIQRATGHVEELDLVFEKEI